jgi:2-iminobutanoate/2-iminopropanoate deaminase
MKEVLSMKKVYECPSRQGSASPYSHAVAAGDLLFVSGQVPFDWKTGKMVSADFETEATLALRNVKDVLEECGSSLERVVKITVFLKDIADFGRLNDVYRQFFPSDYPARTCIQAGDIPAGAKIEVEAIACL